MSAAPAWLARGEAHLPDGVDWLGPWERARLDRMTFTKRRVEFLTSRLAAKHALAAAGLTGGPPSSVEVRHAPGGAPIVAVDGSPTDLAISLTDRAGWAVALVGPSGPRLGCDLELVEPRSDAFVRDYLTRAEIALVTGADPSRQPLLANLCWSAKESALKVLTTGLRRDTRSVEVTLADPDADGQGWAALTVTPAEGGQLPGFWCRFGPFLLTVAAETTLPAPTTLESPPALQGATPVHSWLARPR